MKITKHLTDTAILEEMGGRLGRRRLDRELTQAALAEQAGLSKRTVERIEAGATVQVSSLIRVLRVLELVEGLEAWIPETGPRPLEVLKRQGRQRKRASSKRKTDRSGEPWSWGDEA